MRWAWEQDDRREREPAVVAAARGAAGERSRVRPARRVRWSGRERLAEQPAQMALLAQARRQLPLLVWPLPWADGGGGCLGPPLVAPTGLRAGGVRVRSDRWRCRTRFPKATVSRPPRPDVANALVGAQGCEGVRATCASPARGQRPARAGAAGCFPAGHRPRPGLHRAC